MLMVKAELEDIEYCADILYHTKVGKTYYPGRKIIILKLKQALEQDEVYIARDKNGIVAGFFWLSLKGAFATYPYLHIIAVAKEYRNRGIGGELLNFLEKFILEQVHTISTKVFLVVAAFNQRAYSLYIHHGYEEVCDLADLFRPGVTERLLKKTIQKDI